VGRGLLPLKEIESILAPGNVYWDIAHNITEVKSMRAKWYSYFRGKEPHTKVIKREDYFLMAFWRGKRS